MFKPGAQRRTRPSSRTQIGLGKGKTIMNFNGVLEVDGKRQRIEASSIELHLSDDSGEAARGGVLMGTQVHETFSISGDTLVTSATVTSGGTTTTTTTTTDTRNHTSTTTTTTTDSDGNTTTTIEIKK